MNAKTGVCFLKIPTVHKNEQTNKQPPQPVGSASGGLETVVILLILLCFCAFQSHTSGLEIPSLHAPAESPVAPSQPGELRTSGGRHKSLLQTESIIYIVYG